MERCATTSNCHWCIVAMRVRLMSLWHRCPNCDEIVDGDMGKQMKKLHNVCVLKFVYHIMIHVVNYIILHVIRLMTLL